MSPFYIFERGPKEVDRRMHVATTAEGVNDFCASLSPLENERMKVKMLSFNAFGITESGRILDREDVVKAESFLIYDGDNSERQEIVIYSRDKIKTRGEWWREQCKLMS